MMALPAAMDALVIEAFGKVALRRMPLPEVPRDGVLIKVHYSGVSVGTETLRATGAYPGFTPPFVPGYQAAGIVVAAGVDAAGYAPGDAVAIFCRGSHAAYAATAVDRVHRLSGPAALRRASLFVQPSVGANALDIAAVASGETVLVIGQGLFGQATVQLARLRGAFVVAAEKLPARRALAARHCADVVLDAAAAPLVEQVSARFPQGVDVVLETSGVAALIADAIACARQGGRVALVGYYPGDIAFPFAPAHQRELRLLFPVFIGKPPVRQGVLRLLDAGSLALDPLISHDVPFAAAADLYQSLFTPARDQANGICIDWRGSA